VSAALATAATPALELLLRATLLMGAAWLAAAALRTAGASAAARHVAWLFGIAALLALPLLWWAAPAVRLQKLPRKAESAGAPLSAPFSGPAPASADFAAAHSSRDGGWGFVLLALYALGAAALLLRFVIGRRTLARLWRTAERPGEAAWQGLIRRLSREMQLSRPVELRIVPRSVMPMTWGTLRPKLLLPAEACGWSAERRRLVLLHELAHVARRDSLSRSIASLACALYWFHPGAWFVARRMCLEQEHAADDRVLAAGGSARDYARSLLHLATGTVETLQPDLAAAMAGMCQLEHRLVSITGPGRRDRPGLPFLFASALLAALATSVVAATVPVSRSLTRVRQFDAEPAARTAGVEGRTNSRVTEGLSPDAKPLLARAELPPFGATAVAAHSNRRNLASAAAGRATVDPSEAASPGGELKPPREQDHRDRPQAESHAQGVPDYGWNLRQPALRGQVGTFVAPAPLSTRLTLAAPPDPASSGPARPRRWPQFIPRIIPAGTPKPTTNSPSSRTAATMLSWSLQVGPR
jgi:beta-lactamase regulating signal transducer with metallopeptidase domain